MSKELPFDWYIRPVDPSITCPSSSHILGTFAIINIVVTVLSVFVSHENVSRFLTCGCIKGGSRKAWRYMFICPVLLQLLANFTIAHVMKGAPGYDFKYSSWELMLFYTVRPRLTFIGLAVVCMIRSTSKDRMQEFKPWMSSFMSNMIAEVILELIALYVVGYSVHYGVQRKYYLVWSDQYKSIGHFAHVFYGGAMYYLISGCVYLLLLFQTLYTASDDELEDGVHLGVPLSILITTWLASWLFWAGFVITSGENYCPPSLLNQALIWSGFSTIGVILGIGP